MTLRWTTERPTKPGWYWYRYEGDSHQMDRCGRVSWSGGGIGMSGGPSDQLYLEGRPISEIETMEWSHAPIEKPR